MVGDRSHLQATLGDAPHSIGMFLMIPLVLIPGLLCDKALWGSQIEDLKSCADIIVADITEQSTISAMAAAVLEAAPAHFGLVGFSLGSQVSLAIMCTAKERVRKLALLSATHRGLLPPVAADIRRAIAAIERGGFEQYLETAYPSYVAAQRAEDPILKRAFLNMAHAVGPDAGVRQMRALLAITSPFSGLNQIACPTIIIGGREDRRTTPAAHKALARAIPRAELVLIDHAAHFTPMEQPSSVTHFLKHWIEI